MADGSMLRRRDLFRRSLLFAGFIGLTGRCLPAVQAKLASAWDQFRERWPFNLPVSSHTTVLKVVKVPLTVNGITVLRGSIVQPDGTFGYTTTRDRGVDVEIVNTLDIPTTIHWHGLYIPNDQDGVPFVTQPPIPPGAKQRIKYPLTQDGTFWMHSHYGLQIQDYVSAPFLILNSDQSIDADQDHTVMLRDFSYTESDQILRNLENGLHGGGTAMASRMSHFNWNRVRDVFVQGWDDNKKTFVWQTDQQAIKEPDVVYDALLANQRTIDDPEVIDGAPGETILLRFIAASAFVNWFIDLGELKGTLLATDANPVESITGHVFQLAIAQRLAIRVTLPTNPGIYPIMARGERSNLCCGIVLRSSNQAIPTYQAESDQWIGRQSFVQEQRIRATQPLASHVVDNQIPVALTGPGAGYKWSLNHKVYPYREPFVVKRGERVEMLLTNPSPMGHPMHLHGHEFQIVELDGQRIQGAVRDTVLVPSGSNCRIAFDANQPGVWAFHCHITYHDAAGMFNVVAYESADLSYWSPEKLASEILKF